MGITFENIGKIAKKAGELKYYCITDYLYGKEKRYYLDNIENIIGTNYQDAARYGNYLGLSARIFINSNLFRNYEFKKEFDKWEKQDKINFWDDDKSNEINEEDYFKFENSSINNFLNHYCKIVYISRSDNIFYDMRLIKERIKFIFKSAIANLYNDWAVWRIPIVEKSLILPLNDRPLPTCKIKKSRIKIAKWLCI